MTRAKSLVAFPEDYPGNRTPEGDLLTHAILELFRLNGLLQTTGDRLVADLGLTSARWQVLGAIVAAAQPLPVAWHARNMATSRQNVQRIVNDLHRMGLVAFEVNPHHRRARLVVLTTRGREVFDASMRLQAPWVDALAAGLGTEDLETFRGILNSLNRKLELSESGEGAGDP